LTRKTKLDFSITARAQAKPAKVALLCGGFGCEGPKDSKRFKHIQIQTPKKRLSNFPRTHLTTINKNGSRVLVRTKKTYVCTCEIRDPVKKKKKKRVSSYVGLRKSGIFQSSYILKPPVKRLVLLI
jgi:hypothetical protein